VEGFCNTPSNPWTGGTYSWQLSRIIYCPHRPTRVFCAHFVLTHAHPRKLPGRSPIPNCSKPSTLNLEVLSRQASEKEDAPCWYDYTINSIKPWARTSHPRGQDITGSDPAGTLDHVFRRVADENRSERGSALHLTPREAPPLRAAPPFPGVQQCGQVRGSG
jgi:hypothetical protein